MRYIHSDKDSWFHLKPLVRENRMNQTFAESIIWNALRNKQLGVRFRRQHALYNYIADFICIEKNLIIEIDGETHKDKAEYDNERTKVLNDMGFRVIRFTNDEVIGNGNKVIEKIKAELFYV